jgi:hypothetical protein
VTHTYALLEVSPAAFAEVAVKLREAGYTQAFNQDETEIDLHGLALVREPAVQASPRATVPTLTNGLMVSLVSVLHKDQRYDTCGDWYYSADKTHLIVSVSELPSRREMFLVAIHELIEAFLCECAGITEAEVDKFDLSFSDLIYEEEQKDSKRPADHEWEPGDDARAPYYKQHQIATGIERILAAEVGVSWLKYESHIEELSR